MRTKALKTALMSQKESILIRDMRTATARNPVSIRMVQRKQEPMMKAGKTLITAMDIKL